jgi:hypothetical protein
MGEVKRKEAPGNYGILTDDGIERLKQRIGIQVNKPTPPHNYEVTWDGTRHFAFGYGDDNPLWCDKHYADGTRWGGLIAPPNFLYTMGESDAPPVTPEIKALMSSLRRRAPRARLRKACGSCATAART